MNKTVMIKRCLLCIILAGVVVFSNVSFTEQKTVETSGTAPASRGITLVIDAGHGGADGGAVSDSGLLESEVNMDIAAKLDLIMGFYGIHVVMTRTSENIDYSSEARTIHQKKVEDSRNRVQLINSIDHAFLISIHQNTFPDGGPFGAQVLYTKVTGSKEIAEPLQQLLINALNPKNYRSASTVPGSVYLMNKINCPAVLIECGFLSNSTEEALLKKDAYRLKIAAAIAAGYLSNDHLLTAGSNGGTNEVKDSILLYGMRQ
jgi:N-acetylmuramoyl-L-alanine amidase